MTFDTKITTPLAYKQFNATATVSVFNISIGGITSGDGARCLWVRIQAEAQDLRYIDTGANPSTTFGMLIPAGTYLDYYGPINRLRLINGAAGAICNVTYYC
jgi:hypothetical protein